ncbi:MAG: glutamate 5-kinase [Desulfurivibrionaceae bacterium]
MISQLSPEEGCRLRNNYLSNVKRVVVKVGSAVLASPAGLNQEVIAGLVRDLSFLYREGKEIILVSSGAVAAGRQKLSLKKNALDLKEKQAAAAVGQADLIRCYERHFEASGQNVAQILLTHDDLAHRHRYLNIRNTISTLFAWGIIPIVNENDTVSAEELRFGDNDNLGALLTNLIEADMLICLTDVEGLYTGNPGLDNEARLIHTVSRIDKDIYAMAGMSGSSLGTGGMQSKIQAAKMVSARGGCSFIGPGREPGVLQKLFNRELVGTFFLPRRDRITSRKHWIAYTLRPKGKLYLDQGACRALTEGGRSLLPSGIRKVRGDFGVGAPVHCLDHDHKAIAAGLVNYSSGEIAAIQGAQSKDIESIIGYKDSDEVIHRDNLVLLGAADSRKSEVESEE